METPVPVFGAALIQLLDPALMKGVPTGLILVFVGGWVVLQFFRHVEEKRRRGNGAERRTSAAELLEMMEEIHTVVTQDSDAKGWKAVYGLKPELVEKLVKSLDVNQAVLNELKSTRGAIAQVNISLKEIEETLERMAS